VLVDPRTGAIKLIDFGLATMLSREARDLEHPEHIEGTLEYMSPEQTGRMNRTQDYRSNFCARPRVKRRCCAKHRMIPSTCCPRTRRC
jgi:serine/threonine protein kinase